MDHYTVRLTNPDARPWTRRDEIRQRAVNCWNMLKMAWLAVRSDSGLFAAVLLNCARSEGDGLISKMTMRSGQEIVVIPEQRD